jgi:hypothetical protein
MLVGIEKVWYLRGCLAGSCGDMGKKWDSEVEGNGRWGKKRKWMMIVNRGWMRRMEGE